MGVGIGVSSAAFFDFAEPLLRLASSWSRILSIYSIQSVQSVSPGTTSTTGVAEQSSAPQRAHLIVCFFAIFFLIA